MLHSIRVCTVCYDRCIIQRLKYIFIRKVYLWPLKTYNGQSHPYCSYLYLKIHIQSHPYCSYLHVEIHKFPKSRDKNHYKQENHTCTICLPYKMRGKNRPRPLVAMFFQSIKIIWTTLVEGNPGTICTKSFWNLTCRFWQEVFWSFSFWLPWQSEFCMEWHFWTTLKGDLPRIIPVKFVDNQPSGLGGDVV